MGADRKFNPPLLTLVNFVELSLLFPPHQFTAGSLIFSGS
jgi:hypothetical protein